MPLFLCQITHLVLHSWLSVLPKAHNVPIPPQAIPLMPSFYSRVTALMLSFLAQAISRMPSFFDQVTPLRPSFPTQATFMPSFFAQVTLFMPSSLLVMDLAVLCGLSSTQSLTSCPISS